MERFELLAQAASLNRSQAMVRIVQHVHLGAKLLAQSRKKLRRKTQIVLRGPLVLRRSILLGRLITEPCLRTTNSIRAAQTRNSRLRAHSFVAKVQEVSKRSNRLLDVCAAGMSIDQDRLSRGATQQLIKRHIQTLRSDVPKCSVNSRNRGHGHRATPPVRAFV